MKKVLSTKLFIVSLLSISFFIINPSIIRAMSSDITKSEQAKIQINSISNLEEKIMCYDANTNETTEVNLKQLEEELKLSNSKKINGYNISELPSIPPTFSNSCTLFPEKFNATSYGYPTTAVRITNTSSQPYKTTCRVEGKFSNGSIGRGSAAIVAPNVALTSAHCVFDKNNNNEKLKNWTVTAGFNNNSWFRS